MFQRGKRRIQKLKLPPSGLSKSESNSRLHSPHSELMDKEERQKMNKSPGLNESIETEEDISISEGPMFQRTPSVNEKIYEFAEKVHSNLKPSSHLNKSPLQKSKSRKNFENKEEKIEEKQIEESEDDNDDDDDDDEDDSGEEDSDTGENNDEEVIMDRLERLKALLLQSTEYDIGAETEMEITTSANTILDSLFVKRPNDPRRYISLENLRKPDLHQIHSELRRLAVTFNARKVSQNTPRFIQVGGGADKETIKRRLKQMVEEINNDNENDENSPSKKPKKKKKKIKKKINRK